MRRPPAVTRAWAHRVKAVREAANEGFSSKIASRALKVRARVKVRVGVNVRVRVKAIRSHHAPR